MRERYRDVFVALHPTVHRYNDIVGFAEFFWDGGTRFLVVYYFRGLKGAGFGNMVKAHWGERITNRGFYAVPYMEVGGIPNPDSSDDTKRVAIKEALDQICAMGKQWGFFVDLTHEMKLLQAIDMRLLFSE